MPYLIVLVVILILSPVVLEIAQSQRKEDKRNLKNIFLFILTLQVISGFLNWENFTTGRSGFELSLIFPNSLLGLFFVISILQILLLAINKSFHTLVVILNFINTVLIFAGMVMLSNLLEFQAVSLASIGIVFLVLLGNVIGLIFINKDKSLLKKYAGQKGFSFIPLLVIAGLLITSGVIYLKTRPMEEIVSQQVINRMSLTGVTKNQAVENVKKLPEVQEFLKIVPNGKVEVDNELEGEYNIHVYEVKDGHTATFNWYRVGIKSGEVRSEF